MILFVLFLLAMVNFGAYVAQPETGAANLIVGIIMLALIPMAAD